MKFKLATLMTTLIMAHTASAATAIDLRHQPISLLSKTFSTKTITSNPTQMKTIRTDVDFNQTTHTRIQEIYAGTPVWNATAVIHTPKTSKKSALSSNPSMNGIVYEGLEKDLASTPSYALTDAQKSKALQQAKEQYAKSNKIATLNTKQDTAQKIIYIDKNTQAHYGYLISFYVDDGLTGAHRPTLIMDAVSLKIHSHWDQVKTIHVAQVNSDIPTVIMAGGIGGNEKTGEVIYDGDKNQGHAPALPMLNFDTGIEILPGQKIKYSVCVLNTDDIDVQDVSYPGESAQQLCYALPGQHNDIFWLSWDKHGTRWKSDEVNGGFSPSLDALYGATVIKNLYQDWYHIPVLTTEDGTTPMKLVMRVHYGRKFENAFWDGQQMTFGDGDRTFYPLTSLDVTAHEISHGFTQQHSNINGEYLAMGALHEAFSDMAAAAAQYYMHGENTWAMGSDIMKSDGALRYMNTPTKDGRSVDHLKDVTDDMDPHLAAGVFNKAFYLIATTKGWDTHKAFDIMVKANMNYWTSSMTSFEEAACGVVYATKDYNYDVADVRVAFGNVGIATDKC